MSNEKDILLCDLEPLVEAITEFKRGSFLQPTSSLFDKVVDNCVALLSKHSFSVSKVPQHVGRLNNTNDLINHYYNVLQTKKGDSVIPYREQKSDLVTAKALIANIRKSLGYNNKDALQFAGRLVERLFDLDKELNLDSSALAMFRTVFGQGKMCWVTERIVASINKERQSQEYMQDLADKETYLYIEKKHVSFGWEDLDKLVENLEKN